MREDLPGRGNSVFKDAEAKKKRFVLFEDSNLGWSTGEEGKEINGNRK